MQITKSPWIRKLATGVVALAACCAAAPATLAGEGRNVEERESRAAFLGVSLAEETEHPDGGARVTEVIEDSPAERAGLEEGDVIQGFGGQAVRGPVSLSERIREHAPGDRVSLDVLRDGDKRKIEVELGEREVHWGRNQGGVYDLPLDVEKLKELGEHFRGQWRDGEGIEGIAPRAFVLGRQRPVLGVQLAETTPELRSHFGGSEAAGVLVSKVLEGMPAEAAGIEVGDLIVAIDGESVASAGDIVEALEGREGQVVKIELVREQRKKTIEVTLPAEEKWDRPTGPRAYYVEPPDLPAPLAPLAPLAPIAPPAPPAPPETPSPAAPALLRVERWV